MIHSDPLWSTLFRILVKIWTRVDQLLEIRAQYYFQDAEEDLSPTFRMQIGVQDHAQDAPKWKLFLYADETLLLKVLF